MISEKKKRVPIIEEDKTKSYFKYYDKEMAQAPREKYAQVLKGPVDTKKALKFKDRNDLFKPGVISQVN
ncbi:hypothetical protein [Alkalibacter mobilis]|uniref:hypothetical protein n=1 Tax=Alkalibacter mobilis TaxID=2787712 RepID=UPI00189D2D53|nr:hypothetical protein [Alkalibacter mobilis]MBF7097709.1 hypothetical protein [Alkalibacter mobilis]